MKLAFAQERDLTKFENQIAFQAKNLCKSYNDDINNGLNDINFTVHHHEIVSILGPSGCGKSTLLRLLAGLIKPTSGMVFYQDETITKPLGSVNIVFQHYALLPWLTVSGNIAIGLQAQKLSVKETQQKVTKLIKMIGLEGYENSYPSELSGGMCQRVGFARALVMEPEALLLDEPFSALDAVTAKKLRRDFMVLWGTKQIKTKAVIMVTHNILEAIDMSDRLIILSKKPSRVVKEIKIRKQTLQEVNTQLEYKHRLEEEIFDLLD